MTAGPSATSPGSGGSGRFSHDGLFWRRLARLGAAHGPRWFVEHSPSIIGVAAALALPSARRAVKLNLRRIRGTVSPVREAREVLATFANYAGCLAEVLSYDSKNEGLPDLSVRGRDNLDQALAAGKGAVMVTAHTAGWELAGPIFRRNHGIDMVMVMEAERDDGARELHDRARRATGVEVFHVGADPLAALPLLHMLRRGAALALQIDRVPPGMRGVPVRLLGERHIVPEGPLRLAELSGAPIIPIFCARLGYRSYVTEIFDPVVVSRRPSPAVKEAVAQRLADAMAAFVTRYPTQWFDFGLTSRSRASERP